MRDPLEIDDIEGTRPKKWWESKIRDHMSVADIDGAQNHHLMRLPVDKPFDDYSDVTREVGSHNIGKSPFIHK